MRICALLAFFLYTTPLMAEEAKVLLIYTWFDFLPHSVVKRFERETGIKVIMDHYDNNQTLEANLLTKSSGYDLVFPTAWPFFYRQIKKNLYQPLNKAKLTNWQHLDKGTLAKLEKADPGNVYSVPYFWGITGIGYNKAVVDKIMPDAPLDSWAMILDPTVVSKFAEHGVYLLDDSTDVFSAALVYLGYPPYSREPKHLEEAYEVLVKVRPYIRRFDSYRAMSDLPNGEACLAQNWSGDAAVSRERAWEAKNGVEIRFAIPKEGVAFWMDVMAIPIDATHPDNAHKFINFIMDPEVMAEITNEMMYANGNAGSMQYLREDIKNDNSIYPPADVVERAFVDEAYDPKVQREMNRMLMKLIMNRE